MSKKSIVSIIYFDCRHKNCESHFSLLHDPVGPDDKASQLSRTEVCIITVSKDDGYRI